MRDYLKPSIEEELIEIEDIIAMSPQGVTDEGEGDAETGGDSGGVGNFW